MKGAEEHPEPRGAPRDGEERHRGQRVGGYLPKNDALTKGGIFDTVIQFKKFLIGRVGFTRTAGRWRGGATSLGWRWGEVSHLGSLAEPHV